MSWVTLFVFGLLGYWLISWLLETLNKKKAEPVKPANAWQGTASRSEPEPEPEPAPAPETARNADSILKYCQELELTWPARRDELQAAYRRKIAQYHPDRMGGLGQDLQDMALARAKAINIAYEKLLPLVVD